MRVEGEGGPDAQAAHEGEADRVDEGIGLVLRFPEDGPGLDFVRRGGADDLEGRVGPKPFAIRYRGLGRAAEVGVDLG